MCCYKNLVQQRETGNLQYVLLKNIEHSSSESVLFSFLARIYFVAPQGNLSKTLGLLFNLGNETCQLKRVIDYSSTDT